MEDSVKNAEWLLREKYNGTQSEEYEKDLQRLEKGVPLSYLIGWVPFLSATISLSSHPLIPRPETEYWTKKAIDEMREIEHPLRVLDLCAGSGCIGISVLQKIPNAVVDFAEINTAHHATISENIIKNDIDPARARIFGGDLFDELTDSYDYILSNPPYIDSEANTVDINVVEHEPHEALFGGEKGFQIIERILHTAPSHLREGGVLCIEHEPAQVALISKTAQSLPYSSLQHEMDQYGVLRYTRLTRA